MSTPTPGQPSQSQHPPTKSTRRPMPASGAQVRFIVACGLLLVLVITSAVASAASGRGRPSGRATPRPARTHTPAPAPTSAAAPTATLPVVPPTSVYFIASSAGTGATLNALDGASGSTRWPQPPAVAADAQIAVGENIVFVLAPNGALHAFQAGDGKQAVLHQPSLSGKFTAPPVVNASADLLYAVSQGDATTHSTVYALRARNGVLRWTYDAGTNVSPTIAAAAGALYVHAGNTLLAFNPDSNTPIWHTALEAVAPTAPPVPADGGVYLTSAGVVYRYAADGKLAWQYPSHGLGSPSGGVPISAGDGLVIFSSGDTLTALNSETGQKLWVQSETTPIVGTAYHDHALYVALQNGTLLALDVSGPTPKQMWSVPLGDSVLPPQVGPGPGGAVYTVAVSGAAPQTTTTVYALDPHDGHTRWQVPVNGGSVVQFVVA
ncbi:MAG TPA: PQQ-binding-like beta-propeller repeat protein [Ktedonobacterales bacterium]|nr:PQQ-binding-like beta-propeller repeat protein [Ktedonobacterales bacterium]